MKFITEKVSEGVLSLSNIPTHKLKEMCQYASDRDKDTLGHEIMYRDEEMKRNREMKL